MYGIEAMRDYERVHCRADHVGVTTRDLHRSLGWYQEVLGFHLIRGPIHQGRWSAAAPIHRDIFGASWTGCRIAYLVSEEGIGLELFEFDGPGRRFQGGGGPSDVDRCSGTYASHTSANALTVEAMAQALPGTSDGNSAVEPRAGFDHRRPGLWHMGFVCGNVSETLHDVVARGAVPLSKVHSTAYCTLVYLLDPSGVVMELIDTGFRRLHEDR